MKIRCIQELDTSGARAVECFVHRGQRYLVIPQLACDVDGAPARMTLGNSDVDAPVFRWNGERFEEQQRLHVPGGEDAEYFEIGKRAFVATASLRSGAGPYELDCESTIFEFHAGRLEPFQQVPTYAAKQWRHFRIGQRHFLALAQGVVGEGTQAPRNPRSSVIMEWDGSRFLPFQEIDSGWGYNWAFFEVGGESLLAYADQAVPSRILRWNGERFADLQQLDGKSGRAFCFFEAEGAYWLAFANLLEESRLYRWTDGRFELRQTLEGRAGREFVWVGQGEAARLVRINFILGSREEPITALQSQLLRMEGGLLVTDAEFDTFGATDAAAFEDGGRGFLVVANSLSADQRFRTPTRVYAWETQQ